jgi:hypothetical protein
VALSFGPDGKLYVQWRDRRSSDGSWQGAYDVWVRQVTVTAGGATKLGVVLRMTSRPQPATTISTSTRSSTLSEFYGLATAAGQLAAAWDQVVGSLTDAVYHRVPLWAFGTPRACRGRRPRSRPHLHSRTSARCVARRPARRKSPVRPHFTG